MADDLDAFFDEVNEAEEKAKEEEDGDVDALASKDEATKSTSQSTQPSKNDDEINPPKKKRKRPMGIVVAAAASSSAFREVAPKIVPASLGPTRIMTKTDSSIPPPPPPPPLPKNEPSYLPSANNGEPNHSGNGNNGHGKKYLKRQAAGKTWVDSTLADWPENDYRLFVGNLAKDVTDPQLYEHFSKYSSLQMVKVVRNQSTGVSKGFGFVSLMEPLECARALREMDQSWLSSRPIQVKRSDWKDRSFNKKKKQRR